MSNYKYSQTWFLGSEIKNSIFQFLDKSTDIRYDTLYGRGITYTNLLDSTMRDDSLDVSIEDRIKSKEFDCVIYGSYHRGMPHYDLVSTIYEPNEIILLCGEDLHACNYVDWMQKGHHVFVREL